MAEKVCETKLSSYIARELKIVRRTAFIVNFTVLRMEVSSCLTAHHETPLIAMSYRLITYTSLHSIELYVFILEALFN